MADESDNVSYVKANTFVGSPPLCPELKLRLLTQDAPLTDTAPTSRGQPHIFDSEGPRPYWAFAWGSGQALARFILDNPQIVRAKHVLDVGAGCGTAAIAAAKAGAASVTAIDVDPIAVQAIMLNAGLNDVRITAKKQRMAECTDQSWNVLLVGDVCCMADESDVRWLCSQAREDRLVLVGEPPQRGFPKEKLEELVRYKVRTIPDWEHHSLKEACVYCLPPVPQYCKDVARTNQQTVR